MYLSLEDLAHLREDPTVRFNVEVVEDVEFVIVAYMISNDDLWQKRYGKETRGTTFHKETGEIVSLPFEKFFNVGEKEWTQPATVAWDMQYTWTSYVAEKRDGSMITGVVVNDKVRVKTKKSFYSDVAIEAQAHLPHAEEKFIKWCARYDLCPIFEFTSPNNKVVIDYGQEPGYTLLAIRSMNDGSYARRDLVESLANTWNIPVVPTADITFEQMQKAVETTEGIEGWVIYAPNGRYKIKTKWYCDRHRLIDIRERDIARFVVEEILDDMIPNLIAGECDMTRVAQIEKSVVDGISELKTIAYEAAKDAVSKFPTVGKEQADYIKSLKFPHCLQKHVFRLAKEPDADIDSMFVETYGRVYLKEFSLRSIGNPNFRDPEDE